MNDEEKSVLRAQATKRASELLLELEEHAKRIQRTKDSVWKAYFSAIESVTRWRNMADEAEAMSDKNKELLDATKQSLERLQHE